MLDMQLASLAMLAERRTLNQLLWIVNNNNNSATLVSYPAFLQKLSSVFSCSVTIQLDTLCTKMTSKLKDLVVFWKFLFMKVAVVWTRLPMMLFIRSLLKNLQVTVFVITRAFFPTWRCDETHFFSFYKAFTADSPPWCFFVSVQFNWAQACSLLPTSVSLSSTKQYLRRFYSISDPYHGLWSQCVPYSGAEGIS